MKHCSINRDRTSTQKLLPPGILHMIYLFFFFFFFFFFFIFFFSIYPSSLKKGFWEGVQRLNSSILWKEYYQFPITKGYSHFEMELFVYCKRETWKNSELSVINVHCLSVHCLIVLNVLYEWRCQFVFNTSSTFPLPWCLNLVSYCVVSTIFNKVYPTAAKCSSRSGSHLLNLIKTSL